MPDSLAIVAEMDNGVTASFHYSTAAAFGPGHRIAVHGSCGALVYQMFTDRIFGATEGEAELHEIEIPADEIRE